MGFSLLQLYILIIIIKIFVSHRQDFTKDGENFDLNFFSFQYSNVFSGITNELCRELEFLCISTMISKDLRPPVFLLSYISPPPTDSDAYKH